MKNNVDLQLSFNSWDISIQKTLNTSKSAIFADSTFLDWGQKLSKHTKDLPCIVRLSKTIKMLAEKILQGFYFQFKPVWTTYRPTRYGSMIMKKGSQFTRIFAKEIRKLETTGNNDLLKKRYSGSKECKAPLKEKPLGFEKSSFLFVMLMIGSILSILVLLLEYANQQKKKTQEITTKDVKISLIVEKFYEYTDGFGLSNLEIENILRNLYQKHIRKHQDLLKMDSDEVKFKLDSIN